VILGLIGIALALRSQHNEIDEALLALCKNQPALNQECKDLFKLARNVSEFIQKTSTLHGLDKLENIFEECEKLQYKDIFKICKTFKELSSNYAIRMDRVGKSLISLAQSGKPEIVSASNIYSLCKGNQMPICDHIVALAKEISSSTNSKEYMTADINRFCEDRPNLAICKHMKSLAQSYKQIVGISKSADV